jgi:hypothetical protein
VDRSTGFDTEMISSFTLAVRPRRFGPVEGPAMALVFAGILSLMLVIGFAATFRTGLAFALGTLAAVVSSHTHFTLAKLQGTQAVFLPGMQWYLCGFFKQRWQIYPNTGKFGRNY